MEKYGFIYIWYDKKHNRFYVGCHWGKEDDGYVCSSTWMLQAYFRRPNDFRRRILKSNIFSRSEMYEEEMRWLQMIKETEIKPNTTLPRYYNFRIKSNATWLKDDDQRKIIGQKISLAKKGKKVGPYSDDHKKAISDAKKGWNPSSETRERMRQARLGKTHSDEWKVKNSEMVKEQWASGQRTSNGPISEEHKMKIGAALRGRKLSPNQIDNMKKINSKEYLIEYYDGRKETVKGLKQYGVDKGIPYVSLFKAAQKRTKIPKYKIKSITLYGV